MTERITQTRTEDAIAEASDFLRRERGAELDGGFASAQVAGRVAELAPSAQDILESAPIPKQPGFYMPLGKPNANRYDEAVASLPGYMVLVPSSMVEPAGESNFYPAVVSEDGLKNKTLRLHVLRQAYRRGQLAYGAAVILSGAGQSETEGVGRHGVSGGDGVEAEHFATLLAAGSDRSVQSAWQRGEHINHTWRERSDDSVTSEVSRRLFGGDIPQRTITISRRQVEEGRAAIFWHEGMRGDDGRPETATRDNALVVVQALGHEALTRSNPAGADQVKRMLAV